MAQLPSRTSVMVRSSRALQVLDGLSRLQSCRGGLISCRSKYAWRPMLVSMRISISAKWFSAERPRACTNLRRESSQKRAPSGLQFGVRCGPHNFS